MLQTYFDPVTVNGTVYHLSTHGVVLESAIKQNEIQLVPVMRVYVTINGVTHKLHNKVCFYDTEEISSMDLFKVQNDFYANVQQEIKHILLN